MGVKDEGPLDHALASPAATNVAGDEVNPTIHADLLKPGEEYFNQVSAELDHKGFLVASTEDLFSAVETLARAQPLTGERLAIMANGGGPGVLAADALVLGGGQLAELEQGTVEKLDFALHGRWSHDNPVDIMGDAGPEEHASALQLLMTDAGTDASGGIYRSLVDSVHIWDCGTVSWEEVVASTQLSAFSCHTRLALSG